MLTLAKFNPIFAGADVAVPSIMLLASFFLLTYFTTYHPTYLQHRGTCGLPICAVSHVTHGQ